MNANFMETEVYSNVSALYSYLTEIFEEGKATGEMKPDLNPLFGRDIFGGTVDHLITRWLLKDMSYSLFDNVEDIFELMVDAFRARPLKASDDYSPKIETIPNVPEPVLKKKVSRPGKGVRLQSGSHGLIIQGAATHGLQ